MVLMGMEIGGAETHVLELSSGLKRKGYDVLVASNGGVYVKELEKQGIKHFKVPLRRRKLKDMVISFFKLAKIILTEKPDIVHGHARIPSFVLGILNKFIKFNFVTTAHWVFDTSGILKYISNWGKRTVAVSEDIKNYLIENYGTVAQDITVTINGIDTEKFSKNTAYPEIIREFSLDENKRKILYISRMDKDRSLVAHHLIEIAEKLEEIEQTEIIIVGGGDDFENIKEKAENVNLRLNRRAIILTGARTDIYKFVSVSDFFVGVSRSALEAMSAGIPSVIAGNEGYIGVFSKDKLKVSIDTNFCCRGMALSNTEMLFNDVSLLLKATKEEINELSSYSKEFIKENYSVDKMVNDNLSVYNDILEKGLSSDVVISGYYGYNNSGDDALLHLIIKDIKTLKPDTRFTVLSNNPKHTSKTYGVGAVYRFNPFSVIKAIKSSKLLLSGGGSLIQDATSTKSLLYYVYLIHLAIKSGKKTMLYANGIGPIYSKKNLELSAKVLNKVDVITLRDENSVKILSSIGINPDKIHLTADPAIRMTPIADEKIVEILKTENIPMKNYFAVSVRSWKDTDVSETLPEVLDYVAEKYSLTPLFIPMQKSKDLKITQKCIDKMTNKAYMLTGDYSFSEIMSIVSKSSLVIGMRLHMLMYGANTAVPVIGIDYDPKVKAYLSYLKQDAVIDVNNIDTVKFKAIVDDIVNNYDNTTKQLKQRVDYLKEIEKDNALFAVSLLKGGNV